MERNLTCIQCPIGCYLTVVIDDKGEIESISGNQCNRGIKYAEAEVTNPTRMMTSTVRLHGAAIDQLPVKSEAPVAKDMVKDCVRALKPVDVNSHISVVDVILSNVCATDFDIVATRSVPATPKH